MMKRLWPQPTVDEIVAELRRRAEENRRDAKRADDNRCIVAKVCERTAQELERIVLWIEGN
jgi:hypothetical protein